MSLLATPGLLTPKFFRPKGNWLGQSSEEVNNTLRQILLTDGNTKAWFRPGVGITGTLTASAWADQSGNGNNLSQGTAGNQPIYLPFTEEKYGWCPGVAGNYFSTPDSAANSITGDIDIRFYIAANAWSGAANEQKVVTKANAAPNISWLAYINGVVAGTGTLAFAWSADGTNFVSGSAIESTAAVVFTAGQAGYGRVTLDVDNGAGGYDLKFYTSTNGVTWTQLGTTITGGATTSIFNSNAPIQISSWKGAAGDEHFLGKVYRAQIYNGIGGTLVNDFNPSLSAETSTNGATFTAATGEVWTLNSTGATPAQIVGSPSLLFDGTAHYLKASAFTLNQPISHYLVWKQVTWTNQDAVFDGNTDNTALFEQYPASSRLDLYSGTNLTEAASTLALNTYGVTSIVFNGANSLLQTNTLTALTGNVGTNNAGGLTLASLGSTPSKFGNIQVKEWIVRSSTDSAAQRLAIQIALARKHGITL